MHHPKHDNSYHVLVKRAKKIDDSNTSIQQDTAKQFDVVESPSSIKENLDQIKLANSNHAQKPSTKKKSSGNMKEE